MVKGACDGCKAPYQIDERRIPASGLKMRCSKCGKSLVILKDGSLAGAPSADADLPAPAPANKPAGAPPRPPPRPAPPAPKPAAAPPPAPVKSSKMTQELSDGDWEEEPALPAPAPKAGPPGKPPPPPPPRPRAPEPPPAPAGFGASDDLDLPVVRAAGARAPAPAIVDEASFGDVDLPAPTRDKSPFGEIDLRDEASFGDVDLPAPIVDEASFGDVDLPAPSRDRSPFEEAELPAAGRARDPFGEAELPAAGRARDPFGDPDLPATGRKDYKKTRGPAARRDFEAKAAEGRTTMGRAPRDAFGEVDLPSVPLDDGLPAPVERDSFGEIDFPLAAGDLPDLPSPDRDVPSVRQPVPAVKRGRTATYGEIDPFAEPDLPHKRPEQPSFGEIDLPEASLESGLPSPAAGFGLPAPAEGFGLPAPAQGFGLPAPVTAGLPTPATSTGLPVAATGTGLPSAAIGAAPAGGSLVGAGVEEDIGEEAAIGGAPSPFDDSDRAVPMQAGYASMNLDGAIDLEGNRRSMVGDEVDISKAPAASPIEQAPVAPMKPAQARRDDDAPRRPSNTRKIALAAAVLVAIGGASLALEPSMGAFGVNFVLDRVNAGKYAAQLADVRRAAGEEMAADTAMGSVRAIDRSRALQASIPRYKPAGAYAAFVIDLRGLRFGKRAGDDALAKQMLGAKTSDASDVTQLALAAEDAIAGQLARARTQASAVTSRAPNDLDAAVLVGEIELAAKSPDAVAAWKRAIAIQKNARTSYGLARALLAQRDLAGAEQNARDALKASPKHAASRTMIASLVWQDKAREVEALDLLKQVTEQGEVRSLAGDGELVEAFTMLGRIHLARSRISAAEQAFAAALKLDPQAVQALVGAGELYYRSGRFSEALSRFEAAVLADADNVVAKVGTAKAKIGLERTKEAKDLLQDLHKKQPKIALVSLWLGRAQKALGAKKDAEQSFLASIQSGGEQADVVDAYVALANLLSADGRAEEAASKLKEASDKFPGVTTLNRARGEVALQVGRFEEAKQDFEAVLAKEDDLAARFKLGMALRRLRQFDEASKVFDQVATVDKEYPGLALERGNLLEETGHNDRAIEAYNEALRIAPNDVDLKLRVGSSQVMAGHAKQAEAILREVHRERPNHAEANHFLGRALLMRGANSEAMKYLETAAAIDPNRAEYHLYIGWAANEAGQTSRAESALRRALELDKDLGDAYWQMGVLLQKLVRVADAIASLEIAIKKRPSRYEAYATLALCLQEQQKWAEAEAAWRKAIAGNDSIAEWHYRLGKIIASHGNKLGARPELEKATTLGDVPGQQSPPWLYDAYFLAGEGARAQNDKEKAIHHFQRFLELVQRGNPYIKDAKNALKGLGVQVKDD